MLFICNWVLMIQKKENFKMTYMNTVGIYYVRYRWVESLAYNKLYSGRRQYYYLYSYVKLYKCEKIR